jgi:hypothetical protein
MPPTNHAQVAVSCLVCSATRDSRERWGTGCKILGMYTGYYRWLRVLRRLPFLDVASLKLFIYRWAYYNDMAGLCHNNLNVEYDNLLHQRRE